MLNMEFWMTKSFGFGFGVTTAHVSREHRDYGIVPLSLMLFQVNSDSVSRSTGLYLFAYVIIRLHNLPIPLCLCTHSSDSQKCVCFQETVRRISKDWFVFRVRQSHMHHKPRTTVPSIWKHQQMLNLKFYVRSTTLVGRYTLFLRQLFPKTGECF